jgi:6-phosphofructokinase 1
MGLKAIECIHQGRFNRIVAYQKGKIIDLDIEEALSMTKTIDAVQMEQANILSARRANDSTPRIG